jgi:hypothetical protein
MTVQEAINRGNNLAATAIAGLAGLAFAPEILLEDQLIFKLDDLAVLLIGLRAIFWYRQGRNRFTKSMLPFYLILADLAWKIFAVIAEFSDKEDVGDDFGALVLFVLASILVYRLITSKQAE